MDRQLETKQSEWDVRAPRGRLATLLWAEWLAHGRALKWFAVVWLAGVWILPLFFHPLFFLIYGAVYVLLVAPAVGGRDLLQGTTEHTLSLPATRGQIFGARAIVAMVPLLFFLGVGLLATGFAWPQAVWGLIVDSGFTEPFGGAEIDGVLAVWSVSAFGVPLLGAALAFVFMSLARSVRTTPLAGLAGLILAGITAGLGVGIEAWLWKEPNGWILIPLELGGSLLVLGVGLALYRRRDGVDEGGEALLKARNYALGSVLIVFLAFIAFMLLLQFSFARVAEERARAAEDRARQEAVQQEQRAREIRQRLEREEKAR